MLRKAPLRQRIIPLCDAGSTCAAAVEALSAQVDWRASLKDEAASGQAATSDGWQFDFAQQPRKRAISSISSGRATSPKALQASRSSPSSPASLSRLKPSSAPTSPTREKMRRILTKVTAGEAVQAR